MVKRIVWSANALSDRIGILDYWYARTGSKIYSKKLDNSIKSLLKHLISFPEMGRKVLNREERYLVKDAYLVFYTICEDEIHIVHIWDSRRNPNDLKIQ